MRWILIVDDNPAVRDVLRTIFLRADYGVVVADGGQAALKKLAEQAFDLALVDIEMPGLTGYDVCTYIKTHAVWRKMPVLLMTGRALADVPEKVKMVGASSSVVKRFDRESILRLVKAVRPSGDASAGDPTS